MADEITINVTLDLANGSVRHTVAPGSLSVDQTTARRVAGTQTIGTAAHEALADGDISTQGYVFLMNTDDTNYVEIGIDSGGTFYATVKLKAGEYALLRAAGNLYAKANTSDVELDYVILED